jgi:azurin
MFIQRRLLLSLFIFLFIVPANAHPAKDTVTTVIINAVGGLQYDTVRFKVRPGAKVKIIFTNKDDMSHNLVITKPGARSAVVKAALDLGTEGQKMNYIPALPEVLWSVPILGPGETKTITFTAPQTAGIYPYVCTYPGHGAVMYGAMYVTNGAMPAIKDDPNIPPSQKKDLTRGGNAHRDHAGARKAAHPYKEIPPYLYRIFLPDAGPAAIAVSLPHNLSYCWDAGTCRMRYAWEGGFLDNTDIWKGHHDAYGLIMGTVFFRDKTAYPLQVDKPGNIPVVAFKGYQLIERYPEFHYTINGIAVYELIKPKEDGTGLTRWFRIPKTDRTIWFVADSTDGVSYESSAGKWINGKLRILPEEARRFTITMNRNKP